MTYLMVKEALEAPEIIRRKLAGDKAVLGEAVRYIQERSPYVVASVARGSSDHAAGLVNYLISSRLGILTTSLPPSLVTLHHAPLDFSRSLVLAISQSGASPDLVQVMTTARERGAATLAMINQPHSPLADAVDCVLPLGAGPEQAIAATKTFLASLVTGLELVAAWQNNLKLSRDLLELPDLLAAATQCERSRELASLQQADHLIVLGRGAAYPIAQEVALKFNEVCRLPALAYSSAEFKHGPISLIRAGSPVLIIGSRGPELPGVQDTVRELQQLGANVIFVAPDGIEKASLGYPKARQPLFDPIVAIQALYPLIAEIAVARGYDPDRPCHLQKVTRTI